MQKTNFSRISNQLNNLLFGFLSDTWRSKSIGLISVLTGYFLFANFFTNFITESKNEFLKNYIIECISVYENKSNSLNLNDSISSLFKNKKDMEYNNLNFFYKKLSTIYRYNHGEVQLGFLWDGSTHEEYYKNKWKEFFNKETNKMIKDISFLKYILSIIVLNFSKNKISEYQYKLSTYIRKKFNIQVFKRKGVVLHS